MSDVENKVNGLEAINDDELEAVAGGFYSKDEFKIQAKADGRPIRATYQPKACCGIPYVFAREQQKQNGTTYYHDVKCYKCGTRKTCYPPDGGTTSGR